MAKSKNSIQKIRNYDWRKLLLELLVVFLGVTAGFLLNNWQMNRRDRQLEEKYLQGFLQDVNANIKELESTIKSDSLWLKRHRPKLISIRKKTISLDSANSIIKKIVHISRARLQAGTYEDIKNSGNLNIIDEYRLKKQIVDYHVAIGDVEFIDNYFFKYFSDFVMPFVFSNYNILESKLHTQQIRKTSKFANIVAGYYSMVQQRKAAYDDLLKKSHALKEALDK